ncbi:helix-turn-helix transcriptional regulator [bacterium]|nr:helix-turn-helix transcriptional regulator [bacterium]MBQ4439209.1 helix-turn-helix transcriptional regulator [bacterium]
MIVLKTPQEMAVDAAKRFKEMRKAKKITIKKLSENSGVPYSTIRRFESSGEISFLSLVKIVSTVGEDEEITNLFAKRIPASIEEIIRENRR